MPGKRKNEKGLLGVMKKKSLLFSFKARRGEECSSDSEDSDYYPGKRSSDEDDEQAMAEKIQSKNRRKKIKKESSQASSSKRTSERIPGKDLESSLATAKPWKGGKLRLPPEVLLNVFSYAMKAEGISNVLPRLSLVCKEWHSATADPFFLRHLNLSTVEGHGSCSKIVKLTKQKVDLLLSTRDLSFCQSLSLAGQTKLSSALVRKFIEHTPGLTALDLRGCSIVADTLKKLPDLCPGLSHIDLTQADWSGNFPFTSVEHLVKCYGPQLVELRLGHLGLIETHAKLLLQAVSVNCPVLEELDLSCDRHRLKSLITNSPLSDFDMGELAKACPRLKELRLDGINTVDKQTGTSPYDPGFNKLRVYSQAGVRNNTSHDSTVYKIFSGNDLTELNLSMTNFCPAKITQFHLRSVKKLVLSEMLWSEENRGELNTLLEMWYDSLNEVDLSNNKMEWMGRDLCVFFSNDVRATAPSSLHKVNLSNSTVSAQAVIAILKNCKSLQTVDLTSCRDLPRGCKRVFHQSEFTNVLRILRKCREEVESELSEEYCSESD